MTKSVQPVQPRFQGSQKAFATINIYKRFGPDPMSMVFFDKNKEITSFVERPKQEQLKNDYVWANGSFYIFEPEIFDYIPQNSFTDFGRDVFPKLLQERNRLFAYPSEAVFADIGNHEKLAKAREYFK